MGVVCVVVLERIDGQVVRLTALSDQVSQAREMIYEVTAQSHYRAMALLTNDASWIDKIYIAKDEFDADLAEIRTYALPSQPEFFDQIEGANEVYRADSDEVTKLYDAGLKQQAIRVHIDKEHTQSHVLEAQLNELITQSQAQFASETASFARNRRLLTRGGAGVSAASPPPPPAPGPALSGAPVPPARPGANARPRAAR